MALIATQHLAVIGTVPTFASCAAGDTAHVGDGVTLEVINADTGDHTVTIAVPGTEFNAASTPDTVVTVSHTATIPMRIPLGPEYADPSDGLAHITYSATTSMTRAVTKR